MHQIFLKIASYRDGELPRTIDSALLNAKFPQRIIFGICWQYDEKTYLDLDPYIDHPNFRISQFDYSQSKGCCWARHQCDLLYGGEEYMLQIDAHTRFAPAWDERYICMLENLQSEKPVLSTYPAPFEYIDGKEHLYHDRGVQKLVLDHMRSDLTTAFKTIPVEDYSQPPESHFLAAGQIFAHGQFCENVEYDPELYFAGEEINLSVRAYTHGYEFFCPNEDLIWHLYKHSMPVHHSDHTNNQHNSAVKRLQSLLLGGDDALHKYGLGTSRSLLDFQQLTGLDFYGRFHRQPVRTQFKQKLVLNLDGIKEEQDYDFWIFTLMNQDQQELYRYDFTPDEFPSPDNPVIEIDQELTDLPVKYSLWPHSPDIGFHNRMIEDLNVA